MLKLKHLFSPIKIGSLEFPNRLVMPPMSINFGVDDQGFMTEQHYEYLAERAKHGTGMITVGGGACHTSGLDLPKMPRVWDDKFIPQLSKLIERLSPYESRIGMQLLHGGRQAYLADKVAPSPLPSLGVVKEVPKELTYDQIQELIASHGDAALRCKKAGFDFVEIHAAHGYLIAEFLAPLSNFRQDAYGGSFENRVRFLLEILKDIKEKTGPEYPVGVRINGEDYIEKGFCLEDCLRLAPILEAQGADWLHISAGIYGSFPITIPSMYSDHACFAHLAKKVKEKVSIPVIAVGRIKDPIMADQLIKDGVADMVAMGRAHLADPALAQKAKQGRFESIRPCIGCCMGCIDRALALEESTCVMNPKVSREYLLKELEPAGKSLKILIIGAGCAGLAVARLAALRKHQVTIIDQNPYAGGLAHIASLAPKRSEIKDMIDYYIRELNRLKVPIRLNTKATPPLINELSPEKVVITTGSLPDIPQIQGLFDTDLNLSTVLEVFEKKTIPQEKVIILGGGVAALTLADFLGTTERQIVVLNRFDHYAETISANDRTYLRERLKRPGITLYKKVIIEKFTAQGLEFTSQGKKHTLNDFTDLVIAEKMKSIKETADIFKGKDIPVYIIGDAKKPRTFLDSQTEADELGRTI